MNTNTANLLTLLWTLVSFSFTSGQKYFNSPNNHFGGVNNQAYLAWVASTKAYYNASFFLPTIEPNSTVGAAVHWTIRDNVISLAVAVRAAGWLGFGLAEAGGMEGADMMLFQVSKPNQTTDAYVLENLYPLTDDCQNWNFVSSHIKQGFLIVEVTRALDTGDPQDRKIIRDDTADVPLHRIVAAWGDSPIIGYHGKHRAFGAVRWFQFGRDEYTAFRKAMLEAKGTVELRAVNHSLAAVETDYVLFCFPWSALLAQGIPNSTTLTTIGIEPIIDPRAGAFVHHFEVFAGLDTMEGKPCQPSLSGKLSTVLYYVWAPGEPPLVYPDDVGGTLGGNSYRNLAMQVHYNNPELVSGILDSSGIRIYYTDVPRKYEMGVLQLGDPSVTLDGQTVGEGLTQHVFNCPFTCSKQMLPAPVTVFREQLHMHQGGLSIQNELLRAGNVIHRGRVDFWSYRYQGNPAVVQSKYQVQPGDSFRTVCNYRDDKNKKFGFSTSDEMCVAFIYYYPKVPSELPWMCGRQYRRNFFMCRATYSNRNLLSENALERVFGGQPLSCSSVGS